MLKSAKNRFLALVGGKSGSNEKTQKVKCFSIISRNINPDAQPEIPTFTFYHPPPTNVEKNSFLNHRLKQGQGCSAQDPKLKMSNWPVNNYL